jgi:hypothetical protein
MVFMIDMYVVTFKIGKEKVSWRVSEPELDAFCKILRWNGVHDWQAVKEEL